MRCKSPLELKSQRSARDGLKCAMMAGVCIAFIFQWKGSENLCRRAFEVKTFDENG